MSRPSPTVAASPAQIERLVRESEGFMFDLDGTLYLGEHLIPGAAEVVRRLRARGKKTAFLSNKPIAPREDYAAKLNRLGVPCGVEEVITSPLVLARYLGRHRPGARVFPIAEKPVIEELERHGLRICDDPDSIDVVVVSWDRGFNYAKLHTAYRAAMRGAELVGTNPDRTCPMPGYELPDAACMIAAVEACTRRKVEPIVGKPSPMMLQEALELLGAEPSRCAMLGDRAETDIVMAARAGLKSVLVLTGVTGPGELEGLPARPDLVLKGIWELLPALE